MAPDEVITAESGSGLLAPVGGLEEEKGPAGAGPWRLAWRRLRRDKLGLVFGGAVRAPGRRSAWRRRCGPSTSPTRHWTRTTSPTRSSGTARRSTWSASTASRSGPTWQGEFFLGADHNGRDVMVRLLYGGRNSLLIGIVAALITTAALASWSGCLSGYLRGCIDSALSRLMDIIWAFPVILLGVALGTSLALGGLKIGPLDDRRRPPGDPDLRDRDRLRALPGTADPRPGAGAAREGVRRGGAGAGDGLAGGSCSPRCCPTSPRP